MRVREDVRRRGGVEAETGGGVVLRARGKKMIRGMRRAMMMGMGMGSRKKDLRIEEH